MFISCCYAVFTSTLAVSVKNALQMFHPTYIIYIHFYILLVYQLFKPEIPALSHIDKGGFPSYFKCTLYNMYFIVYVGHYMLLYKTNCSSTRCDKYKLFTQILCSLWVKNFETLCCFLWLFIFWCLTTGLCCTTENGKNRQQYSKMHSLTLQQQYRRTI